MKNITSILLAGIISVISTFTTAETKPAIIIEVANINNFTTELMTLAGKVSPQTPAAMLPAIMGMPIKNPNLAGIDRTKPFQLQLFLPETNNQQFTSPLIVILLPVIDGGKAYLDLLSQSVSQPIEKDGVKIFRSSSTDALYIKISGNYALICDKEEGIKAFGNNIAISEKELLNVKGTLRIGFNKAPILSYLTKTKGFISTLSANQSSAPAGINTEKMLNAEFSALISAIEQMNGMAMGISITDNAIDINSRINPTTGSTLEKVFQKLKIPAKRYQALAPKNALLTYTGTGMDATDLLIKPYCTLMNEIYGSMDGKLSDMGKNMTDIMMAYKGIYVGNFAIGVIPVGDKGIGAYEVVELKDPEKAKKNMMQQYEYSNKYLALTSGLKMNIATNSRTYKNIKITAITYEKNNTSTNIITPKIPLGLMTKFNSEIAYINNDIIYAFGGKKVMDTIIDRILSNPKIADALQFTKVIPNPTGKAVQSYIAYPANIIKTILQSIPGMDPAMFAGMQQDMGGIAGYITTDGSDVIEFDSINMDEILAIKSLIPLIQSMAMGAATQMQMQRNAIPAPPPTPRSR